MARLPEHPAPHLTRGGPAFTMTMHRKPGARRNALALTALLLAAQALFAYEVPLSSHSVREAYFLGQRNDQKTAEFFAPYKKPLPMPQTGPHVAEITLLTPYAQVVQLSAAHSIGYSAQQAEEAYQGRGDTLRVHVRLNLTPTYSFVMARKSAQNAADRQGVELRPDDFWQDFQFQLRQKDATLIPLDVRGEPVYQHDARGSGGLAGAEVWLEYDAAEVASEMVEMEVVTPDGQHVTAKFDLEKLR
ncbi:MAG: hypothetical protein LAN84_00550 [Acidobacteriia bacterium]|nr:hypothetical protein [Terriglobia bacterium]